MKIDHGGGKFSLAERAKSAEGLKGAGHAKGVMQKGSVRNGANLAGSSGNFVSGMPCCVYFPAEAQRRGEEDGNLNPHPKI